MKAPAILRVAWAGGGGHFVVSVGQNGNDAQDFIEILDPYYGYQPVKLSSVPNYSPADSNGATLANGKLDRYWSSRQDERRAALHLALRAQTK
jgi:hypothetical protein